MKIRALIFLCLTTVCSLPLAAVEASVESITTEPVTISWINDDFVVTKAGIIRKIPIPVFSGQSSGGLMYIPKLPDIRDLHCKQITEWSPEKGQGDALVWVFQDLDGNEIELPRGQEVRLLKITITIKLDGIESRVVVWKHSS